jgi:hypothetical protein
MSGKSSAERDTDMTRKKTEVSQDTDVLLDDEVFDWVNSGDTDCEVYDCKPPLVKNSYKVSKHGSASARVDKDAKPGEYTYHFRGHKGLRTDPKIKIGGLTSSEC